MNLKLRKLVFVTMSLVMCGVLVFSSAYLPGVYVHAETLEELEAKYDELEDKMAENEQKMQDIAEDKATQSQKVDALESEIDGLNSQIDLLDKKISILDGDVGTLNNSISELDAQIDQLDTNIEVAKIHIAETEEEIQKTTDTLLKRLAASYMMGDSSTIEFLLGAKSLSEILTWNQYIQNANDYDNKLVKGLEDDIKELEALKLSLKEDINELEISKAAVEADKAELVEKQNAIQESANEVESKKSSVESKRSDAVRMLKSLDSQSAEYARIQKQLAKEQEKVDAEINAYLASSGSSESNPGTITNDGTLIWPMPYKNCYISAYFGTYPSGGTHKGLDICVSGGTAGKNVVAAQSGKVIQMGYGHWSMGNYIILDHGNGLFTAYYHASKLLVGSVGETVKQGQVIMLAGSTGNTTGPHLHFEVRVNKNGTVTQVNPLNYVSMPK